MKNMEVELAGHALETFDDGELVRTVFWPLEGATEARPVVLVCHEMPGITPEFIAFVEHLDAAGFATVVPHLFGDVNRRMTPGYFMRVATNICIAKEFHVLAKGHESPVGNWLRALARAAAERFETTRLGAIGMCFTGNFALGLLLEPLVTHAVASQPSLPFTFTPGSTKALHLSPANIATIAQRLDPAADDAAALALRFSHDPLCPRARFGELRKEFGDGIELHEIDSGPGNPNKLRRFSHSVLTLDLVDVDGHPTRVARERVVAFLKNGLTARCQTVP